MSQAVVGYITSDQIWPSSAELMELATSSALPEFAAGIAYTRKRLRSFLDLPQGWEHDDSEPGNPDHYAAALALLERLPPVPNVPSAMIASDGTLGLFWQLPWLHAEIEFMDAHRFSLYSREWDQERKEILLPEVDVRDLTANWFVEKLPRIFEREVRLPAVA